MFTGIVEELVEVVGLDLGDMGTRITVKNEFDDVPRIGDSIAVNGVCLTVVSNSGAEISFDAVPETMQRSNLGDLLVGDRVNLERPMRADGRFDGHVVQGHVDGRGTLVGRTSEGGSDRLRVELGPELARYVVEKGSITVDGVSLTVTAVGPDWFEFVVIPHTLEVTTLGSKRLGESVNLEVDVIAKYVERLLEGHS